MREHRDAHPRAQNCKLNSIFPIEHRRLLRWGRRGLVVTHVRAALAGARRPVAVTYRAASCDTPCAFANLA